MLEARRYLGLELAGAKNQKTSLAALEYYPKEKKIFLLDIFDRIVTQDGQTGDEAVLEVIQEMSPRVAKMGVNVPLELPPCISCSRKTCPLPAHCTVPAVKWMKEITRKASKSREYTSRVKEFTPYTQRPIELWIRYQVLSALSQEYHFEVDEALGGSRAPLTARMHFLKRQLQSIPLIEVSPKLSVAILCHTIKIPKRIISTYRQLEDGIHSREQILLELSKANDVFIYERDMRKLSQSLASFDAFICALTALLSDLSQCSKIPKEFPVSSGWIYYPQMEKSP